MSAPLDTLFVGILKDYGEAKLDFSHEFVNLWTGIAEHPRLRARAFHPDLEAMRYGADGMRARFADLVTRDPPALLVHQPFTAELDVDLDAMADLTKRGIPTVEFDADSSWRFDDWIKPRIGVYTVFVTTHGPSVERYKDAGADVHRSQWAVGSWYRGFDPGRERPVQTSFVGRPHGDRREVIKQLRGAGVPVDTWGPSWGRRRNYVSQMLGRGRNHGYAPFDRMRHAIGDSRISLNLGNASAVHTGTQIKGRHFEIPGLGACQVTTPADDIENWFEPEKEIVVADAGEPLVEAVKALHADPGRRLAIAEAAYKRTWAEHTWTRRVDGILDHLGMA